MSYKFKKTGEIVDTYGRGTEVRRGVVVNPSGPRVIAAAERIVKGECIKHDVRAKLRSGELLFGGDDE